MNNYKYNRRKFLEKSLLTLAGTMAMSAFGSDICWGAGDYKALVCIMLEGGADSFNMVVPHKDTSLYSEYQTVREEQALTRENLLELSSSVYGFHPRMTSMQQMFNQGNLAVIANVGMLNSPISHSQIEQANTTGEPIPNLPDQLFSHNTQRDLWMLAGNNNKGWAAVASDEMHLGNLVNISVGGRNLMQRGGQHKQFLVSDEIYAFDDFYRVRPEDTSVGEAYRKLLRQTISNPNRLIAMFAKTRVDEIELHNQLSGVMADPIVNFDRGVHEQGKSLGEQLELVTRLIKAKLDGNDKGAFPNRQIFFVNYHGWDTHNEPLLEEPESNNGAHKVDYLDKSLGTFHEVMKTLGVFDQVTTFTTSDFGRTITSNGNGTDHGWGGNAFVAGGAVQGGFHGTMPEIRTGSPDMWGNVMVPTTSVEQYLAPLVSWLSDGAVDPNKVFPKLENNFPGHLDYMA